MHILTISLVLSCSPDASAPPTEVEQGVVSSPTAPILPTRRVVPSEFTYEEIELQGRSPL